mmetsp:Transcript_8339/g.19999  ORF Transcript_8339/g.19999 Transcript_8339/m.19999 type:complete len:228 (+) Transcript_8339:1255-1938(+)
MRAAVGSGRPTSGNHSLHGRPFRDGPVGERGAHTCARTSPRGQCRAAGRREVGSARSAARAKSAQPVSLVPAPRARSRAAAAPTPDAEPIAISQQSFFRARRGEAREGRLACSAAAQREERQGQHGRDAHGGGRGRQVAAGERRVPTGAPPLPWQRALPASRALCLPGEGGLVLLELPLPLWEQLAEHGVLEVVPEGLPSEPPLLLLCRLYASVCLLAVVHEGKEPC